MKRDKEITKTDEWLTIVARARRFLTLGGFTQWMFTVGNSGTPEERCALGRQALEMLMYRPPITVAIRGPGPSEVKHGN